MCSRFSIDNHQLTIIESDGHPVKPVTVDSLIGFQGETYVVEITADQTVDNYWVRAMVMRTGITKNPTPDGLEEKVLAILRYDGASDLEPKTSPRNCSVAEPCKDLNCAWNNYHKDWYPNRVCIPVSQLEYDFSVDSSQEIATDSEDVHEIFLNFDFPIGSSINHHRNVLPRAPFSQGQSTLGTNPCPSDCADKGCLCTHVIDLPAKKTIQLVMTAHSKVNADAVPMHHPVHIHGHSFQVM